MKVKTYWVILLLLMPFILTAFFLNQPQKKVQVPLWDIRSIDTVKYSRDLTGQKISDPTFDSTIESQVSEIADTGANYIAISTPYDAEYKPMLKRWVLMARKYNLKVWFRGNFSGWEKWFDHKQIGRQEHLELTEQFILNNQDLFEDGDIFTPCPECENGGPGDPRFNGDVMGFRAFLIDEYELSAKSFGKIGKKVTPGYYSMNYDVAKLVMDPKTTQSLGGIVVIDHYVTDPKKLLVDVHNMAQISKGKVILGEFGAPIPDINGLMTQDEQAVWVNTALSSLVNSPDLIGLNYWVNVGGSTQLWDELGKPRKAVEIIKKFYSQTIPER